MLKIFVCEDDQKQRENIVGIIKKYLFMQDYDVTFEFDTSNPRTLLDYVSLEDQSSDTGLYFLDVDLNTEMNGITLGSELRKIDNKAKIVFITTHAELAYLTFLYKIEAMDYIIKDNSEEMKKKIIDCIDVAVARYLNVIKDNDYIVVKDGEASIKIATNEVQFIESSSTPHKLIIHMDNRQIEFYGKIKDMAQLNPSFYRCHQSYVVNTKNIKKIIPKTREVLMMDGEICYASVRYLKGLLSKL